MFCEMNAYNSATPSFEMNDADPCEVIPIENLAVLFFIASPGLSPCC